MKRRTHHLTVRRPFSLRSTVLSHGWHECSPWSWTESANCFQLIDRVDGRVLRLSVTETKRARRECRLRVVVEGDNLAASEARAAANRVRVALRLDEDLTEFYQLCRAHPRLQPVPRCGAGRIARSASMIENITKAICAANVTWAQAVKTINRIGQLGPHFPLFRNLHAWPTPEEILRAGEDYLRGVARVGYRAEYILALCEDVVAGRLSDAQLQTAIDCLPTDELLRVFTAIKGVGPTTAHYLLSMAGRYDRLAIDTSTLAHVSRVHLNGAPATRVDVERIYAPYGKWKQLVWWFEHWLAWGHVRT